LGVDGARNKTLTSRLKTTKGRAGLPADDFPGLIVTDWYRWNDKTMSWDFNHRQHGLCPKQLEPKPISDTQKRAWKGDRWKKSVEIAGSVGTSSLETDQSP
jgi:hypothetical protein